MKNHRFWMGVGFGFVWSYVLDPLAVAELSSLLLLAMSIMVFFIVQYIVHKIAVS